MKKLVRNCANHKRGRCILKPECRVLAGQRCVWFEEAVLPAARKETAHMEAVKEYDKRKG